MPVFGKYHVWPAARVSVWRPKIPSGQHLPLARACVCGSFASRSADTPLHYTVDRDAVEACELLLLHGSDPSVSESMLGFTPLHMAAKRGHIDIAKTLLARGAVHRLGRCVRKCPTLSKVLMYQNLAGPLFLTMHPRACFSVPAISARVWYWPGQFHYLVNLAVFSGSYES